MSQPNVQSVSALTALIKESLETEFSSVWVSGELSEVSRPSSGHIYFTLKDAGAQIRGVVWRSAAARLRFEPTEGQQVICSGGLDVYPPRGAYQLIVRHLEPAGLGALQLAFRQLHERLAKEGLFAEEHKQPLPLFPRRIAFVTSPTGAAIRDFLQIAVRRFSGIQILVIPARVQGEGASDEIVRGIQLAHRLSPLPDVLVVGRGGGSLEDLWCFNEEKVVRAIHAATIPTVSAVGHEIDVTLSDLVADLRALTPSDAAQRIVPSFDDLQLGLSGIERRMQTALRSRAAAARQKLNLLAGRRPFRRPFDAIHEQSQRLDDLQLQARRAVVRGRQRSEERFLALTSRLESVSPLAVLTRGYSVTLREDDGEVVRSADSLQVGDGLLTKLATGEVRSQVTEIYSS